MLNNILKIIYSRAPILGVIISSTLLILAISYEYFGGLIPCEMCLWQRWLHVNIICFCLISIFFIKLKELFLFISASLALISFVVASWHSGIEIGTFVGPKTCSDISNLQNSIDFKNFLNKPTISCEVVLWSFLGLSMASWNAIFSLILSIFLYFVTFYKGKMK